MEIEELIKRGRELDIYLDSEQSDIDKEEDVLDYLFQSIYDVCSLIKAGIIEGSVDDDDYIEALKWITDTKEYLNIYKNKIINL